MLLFLCSEDLFFLIIKFVFTLRNSSWKHSTSFHDFLFLFDSLTKLYLRIPMIPNFDENVQCVSD